MPIEHIRERSSLYQYSNFHISLESRTGQIGTRNERPNTVGHCTLSMYGRFVLPVSRIIQIAMPYVGVGRGNHALDLLDRVLVYRSTVRFRRLHQDIDLHMTSHRLPESPFDGGNLIGDEAHQEQSVTRRVDHFAKSLFGMSHRHDTGRRPSPDEVHRSGGFDLECSMARSLKSRGQLTRTYAGVLSPSHLETIEETRL